MELTQEQIARNSAGSKKELEVSPKQEVKSSDDFELNEEQLDSAAGGVISPPFDGGIYDGDGGIWGEGGCTGPRRSK
jgi:hypothetical protein